MYMNPNYEWMTDWKKPTSFFFETLYWMRLYSKIMRQGTPKDRARLVEWYEKSKSRCDRNDWAIVKAFNNMFNAGQHHAYACEWFIHETKMEALQDDINRKMEIEANYESPEYIAAMKQLCGEDYATRDTDNALLERDLKASQTQEQLKFKKNAAGDHLYPSLDNARKQKLVKSGRESFASHRGTVGINYRIYDKCQGFYTAIVWADNRPKMEDGSQGVLADFSAAFNGNAGITQIMQNLISNERVNVICDFRGELCKATGKVKQKVKFDSSKVNVSHVRQAMGIEKSAADDLEMDIF